jgi:hypothetical protein
MERLERMTAMATKTMTKERPVLFSAQDVRATLDGKKLTFRLPLKPQPRQFEGRWGKYERGGFSSLEFETRRRSTGESEGVVQASFERTIKGLWKPPYAIGSRLWVKHPVRVTGRSANGFRVWDCGFPVEGNDRFFYWHDFPHRVVKEGNYWGASLPRMLSRLTVEIVSVRFERLREMTEADAVAEGCESRVSPCAEPMGKLPPERDFPLDVYRECWQAVHGNTQNQWFADPMVWVFTFRPVD